jgi:Ca2+-binding EF-hand superfamily protein
MSEVVSRATIFAWQYFKSVTPQPEDERAMRQMDAIKDMDVNADDLKELKQSFDACDSNGDGWIVNAEFSELLRTLDQDLSEDECLLAFELTDQDSFEEFMSWWTDSARF